MRIFVNVMLIGGLSVSIVVGLFYYSTRNENRDNGFYRKIPPHVTSDLKVLDLGVNSYYIAGFAADSIYLANYTVPDQLLAVHKNFRDSSRLFFPLASSDTLWGGINTHVDSPYVFITETGRPKVRTASLSDLVPRSAPLQTKGILTVLPLSASSVFGKNYDVTKKQLFFFKEVHADHTKNRSVLFRSLEEGIFTADGIFSYRPGAPHFFYTYYYSNRFTCMDSNLNVVYEGNTIDTFSVADVPLAASKNNTQLTFSSTPRIVNKGAFVSDSLLFIHSNVKANNEDPDSFKKNMVIDVYYQASGKYLFSFYLPNHKNLTCSSLDIHHETIFAIYDTYLISFKLNLDQYRGRFF